MEAKTQARVSEFLPKVSATVGSAPRRSESMAQTRATTRPGESGPARVRASHRMRPDAGSIPPRSTG